MLTQTQAYRLTEIGAKRIAWFRWHMPYVLHPLDEKKHLWLPLNREYKPLGLNRNDFVDYKDYAKEAMRFSRHPDTMEGVFWRHHHLYDDGHKSRLDYFARLEKLFSYAVWHNGGQHDGL
jgi:hypothetical protein